MVSPNPNHLYLYDNGNGRIGILKDENVELIPDENSELFNLSDYEEE